MPLPRRCGLLVLAAAALAFVATDRSLAQGSTDEIAPFSSAAFARRHARHSPDSLHAGDRFGSTDVPMDSWIYPALERLSTLGFIPSQDASIRPWTRLECLRQLSVAEENIIGPGGEQDASQVEGSRLLDDLRRELNPSDDDGYNLESAYTRVGVIAGPALTDGYHFGQTWRNDFGRPLGRGISGEAGIAFRARYHRYFFYDRQELQQFPGSTGVTPAQSMLEQALDTTGLGFIDPTNFDPATPPTAAYTRQRPLELYAGLAFAGSQLSFGKQSLYWGPTTMGALAFSSNAEPTYNLQLVATRPHPIPFFNSLGTYRYSLVFGKLSGHRYPARPYFNGGKISMNFGDNLEVSFTRWSVLWGVGHPMTLGSLRRNLFSLDSTGTFEYGDPTDPGDRKSGFDIRWHPWGLTKLVTLYADSYADDELNPIDAPRRVVWNPGIYLARLPYLPHMDFRLEASSSEELSQDEGGSRFFINNQYRDSNTNKGFLLGNAIGRDARAEEGRFGYWVSPRTRFEAAYRQTKGGLLFLPHGATISDAFVNGSYAINDVWSAQVFAQYERYLIPSYQVGDHHNESGWLQITWNPKIHGKL